MINEISKDAEMHMHKAIDALKNELTKVRTGRAHPSMVENVKVDYYGTETPLKNIANVQVSDPRTLSITPWEKTMVKAIEKAIQNANLGMNPICDANLVRIPVPPLTEERRKEFVKVVKNIAEQSRVAVRNVRRDAINDLKELLKEKEISEDDERRAQDNMQKLTDKFIAEVDKIAAAKEADLLAV
jgi:ribosome recycling factor